MLIHRPPSNLIDGGPADFPQLFGVGMAFEDRGGLINTAGCVASFFVPCIPDVYPDLDTPTDYVGWEPDSYYIYNAGATIDLGPYGMVMDDYGMYFDIYFLYDPHYGDVTDGPIPTEGEEWGLSVYGDGAWPAYYGVSDVTAVPNMEVTTPDIKGDHHLISDQVMPLRWNPSFTGGEVWLHVFGFGAIGAEPINKVWHLTDDGEYDLDLSTLSMNELTTNMQVWLSRTSFGVPSWDVFDAAVGQHSASVWDVNTYYTGDRTLLEPIDVCHDAETALPIAPGSYYGSLTSMTPGTDPGDGGCTGRAEPARDGFYKVILEPDQRVDVTVQAAGSDVAVYLLTDCSDTTTCLGGSDVIRPPDSGTETVAYANRSLLAEVVYIAVDGAGGPAGEPEFFLMDVAIGGADPTTPFPDTCVEATYGPAVPPGGYTTSLEGYADDLNPGPAGCAGFGLDSAGGDAIMKVEVPNGNRVKADSSANNAVYFVLDCTDERTCLAGGGPDSAVSFLNNTGVDQTVFLVVDDLTGLPATVLTDVTVEISPPFPGADTCAGAAAAPPLTTGTYDLWGDFGPYSDELDIATPGPSCTDYPSQNKDVIVPVRLDAGESITVDSVTIGGDGSLYLLTDCLDTTSYVACNDAYIDYYTDAPEHIEYTNDTGAPQDLTLVIDNYGFNYYYPGYGYYFFGDPDPGLYEATITID